MMAGQHAVPDDFPRQLEPGVVPGAQPKLLVREVDGQYHTGLIDEELWSRYSVCEDLARQLAEYAARKMPISGLSLDEALVRGERGLKTKVSTGQWDFSRSEVTWMMMRASELLRAA